MGARRWRSAGLGAALGLARAAASAQQADLVLRGGRVWAGKGLPAASAIAGASERVLAVGDDESVRLNAHARTLPKGNWIQNGNWDHETWPSRALPTRFQIDGATPDHPVLAVAAKLGVTSIQDNSAVEALPAYQQLRGQGELAARLDVWRPVTALPALRAAGVRGGLGDDWLRLGAPKLMSDGAMGSGTAA